MTPQSEQQRLGAFALKQYKAYKLAAGKTAKSILISCSTRLAPFAIDEVLEILPITFFFMHGSERHDRSIWGWDGTDAWFLVSPADTTIWNDSITDTCMYAYYEKY